MTHRPANPHTIAARTGVDTDTAHGSVMPPLYLSSNYSFAGFDQKRKYDYSRSGNPTRDVLAETLAEQLIEPFAPDLVVCGERGLSNIKYVFVGSVSTYLIRNLRCDVLVVKQA